MAEMNKHEKTFRSTGRAVCVLFVIWLLCIAGIYFAPPGIQDTDWRYIAGATIVMLLFAAIFVLGIVQMIAYMRWTGKYPYFFLFRSSRERVRELREEHVKANDAERLQSKDELKSE